MSVSDVEAMPLSVAQSLLQTSSHASLKSIRCHYNDGVVTLRGRVPSYYHKQLAQELVARVDGVQAIVNATEVPVSTA